ncbi:MAG: GntR family transcriptional regulator [Actinomycetota bacterium]|nr:GntR family transcriptional regulator [Actinomycetota bacterium]
MPDRARRRGEEELTALFRISRTPIREALMRLEAERLATRTRRGLAVSAITAEEIIEVYEIREALDGVAARLAARFRTDADLTELRSLHELMSDAAVRGDVRRMARLNVDFHRVLARAARNGMLLSFVDSIHKWVKGSISRFVVAGTSSMRSPRPKGVPCCSHFCTSWSAVSSEPEVAYRMRRTSSSWCSGTR